MALTLLDGPMGTELVRRGLDVDRAGAAWSAVALERDPALVRAIHADYVAAGADVHRANTFRTQPAIFPDRFRELTRAAVALARDAGARTVAGSLAPVADCYAPEAAPTEATARPLHRAMAEALRDAGVDLVVCETFPNGREAVVAVEEAARTGLPVWVALTAGPEATLMTPEAMERHARDAVAAGAAAVLVNCTDARATLAFVARLARASVPFGAYANAGPASAGLGWTSDPRAADAYAVLAASWREAGATILGACCGAGLAHVAALAARFR